MIGARFKRLAGSRFARVVRTISRVVCPVLAFGYLSFVLRDLAGKLPPAAEIVPALGIAAAISVSFPLLLLVLSWHWKVILECVGGRPLELRAAYTFYCQTNIQKYLPSNILHLASRVVQARERIQLDAKTMAKALVVEVVVDVLLTTAFLSAGVSIVGSSPREGWHGPSLLAVAAVALAAAMTVTTGLILRRSAYDYLRTSRHALPIVGFTLLAAHIYFGIGFLTLLWSLGVSVGVRVGIMVMCWQSASWLIGFLTPGLPAGIGVREALLTLTVGQLVDVRVVVIAAGLYRMAQIVGEAFAFLLASKVTLKPVSIHEAG
ncbi:MAG TPA: lysylphosphatidylglycerol synthase domain-containing protein [Myxococcales bacterium]